MIVYETIFHEGKRCWKLTEYQNTFEEWINEYKDKIKFYEKQIENVKEMIRGQIELAIKKPKVINPELEDKIEYRNRKTASVVMAKKVSVYLIQCDNLQLVKIGKASNVNKRLKTLQVGNPHSLYCIASLEFAFSNEALLFEQKLHKKYEEYNVRGEWFEISQRDLISLKNEFTKSLNVITAGAA